MTKVVEELKTDINAHYENAQQLDKQFPDIDQDHQQGTVNPFFETLIDVNSELQQYDTPENRVEFIRSIDPDYQDSQVGLGGTGVAGDYERFLREQVAAWDDDGDGVLSGAERDLRDFAAHNHETAASQSDEQMQENNAQYGEGAYAPDAIVGFHEDGTPITAAEAGYPLIEDESSNLDAVVGGTALAVLSAYNLYNAINGDNELAAVTASIDLINQLDSAGVDLGELGDWADGGMAVGVASAINLYSSLDRLFDADDITGMISAGLGAANSAIQLYNALSGAQGAGVPHLAYINAGLQLLEGDVEGAALSAATGYLMTLGPWGWAAAAKASSFRARCFGLGQSTQSHISLVRRPSGSLRFSLTRRAAELAVLKQSSPLSRLNCDARWL